MVKKYVKKEKFGTVLFTVMSLTLPAATQGEIGPTSRATLKINLTIVDAPVLELKSPTIKNISGYMEKSDFPSKLTSICSANVTSPPSYLYLQHDDSDILMSATAIPVCSNDPILLTPLALQNIQMKPQAVVLISPE